MLKPWLFLKFGNGSEVNYICTILCLDLASARSFWGKTERAPVWPAAHPVPALPVLSVSALPHQPLVCDAFKRVKQLDVV